MSWNGIDTRRWNFKEEGNVMVEKLSKYLEQFMIQSDWLNENVPEQARAIFTTLCFVGNIDVDTSKCDNTLLHLYNVAAMEEIDITYEEFESFMVELIV